MTDPNLNPALPIPKAPRELDLFAFVLLIVRHTGFILLCGAIGFFGMLVHMLRTKPQFASTATMIVPQGNVTSSALAAQISSNTADFLGGGFELYADILKSRVVADRLIADYDLTTVYGTHDMAAVEAGLANATLVETAREGMIRVTVRDTSAQRAADLANDYLHQLDLLNSKLVLTNVGLTREYLQREMLKEKDALDKAEVDLKQVQESTTGVPPEAQASAGLSALEQTRAQLRADQIQLAALLTGATDQNPDVIRLRAKISGESAQVESLQRGAPSIANGTPISQVPAQELEYVRRRREVTFHETLFDLLEKQFAAAKQEEAKNPSIVQVLDPAIPSIHKAWPPRGYYCILATIVGLVAGVFLVGFKAIGAAYMRNPDNMLKLEQLKQSLWKRKTAAR